VIEPSGRGLDRTTLKGVVTDINAQIARLGKSYYLWCDQSFSYGRPMAGRFSKQLTIRQLRALAAVQAAGSVTSAASRLHLTQPAVTLQLRNLQTLAGLPLLQRTGEGVKLTDAGEEVRMLTQRIEAALLDCEQALELIAGRTGGRISIGAVSTAKYFVPFAIAAFSRRSPRSKSSFRSATARTSTLRYGVTTSTSPSWASLRPTSKLRCVCSENIRISSSRLPGIGSPGEDGWWLSISAKRYSSPANADRERGY
jgi:Bacterial regulatory helix-turn-helix protein, lysR family